MKNVSLTLKRIVVALCLVASLSVMTGCDSWFDRSDRKMQGQ